jgi:hypothetical protein
VSVSTGKGGSRGAAVAGRRGLALSLLLAAVAGCAADQPVLTLVFERLPDGTQRIDVTLHGTDATFMGPDAGNDQVGVSYPAGDVLVMINAGYAAARGNHIRLPLTAGNSIELQGTASAIVDAETQTVASTSTSVTAGASATMKFDFGAGDGGTDTSTAGDDAGAIDGQADADAGVDADASEAGAGDVPADLSSQDVPADLAQDVPTEMPGSDVAADRAPADVAADLASPTDTSGDGPATIGINCSLRGQFAASVGTGGSGPTVAHVTPLFGVVWKAGTDLLYNAVSEMGALQLAADKTVVSGGTQGVSSPRLARVGADFALAYGRHDGTGAQAAVVRVAPATGVAAGPAAMGMNRPGVSASPELGGIAVSGDQRNVAVISRPSDLTAQTAAIVDEFNDTFAFVMAKMPSGLGATRTTGIGWAPGRFLAGAVTQATSAGGTLLEMSDDTNLTVGAMHAFTSGTASPVVGSGAATISVAGAGDRVAVAWVDLQGGKRVVTLALVPFSTGTAGAPVPASTSAVTKYYPHLVFDGAAFAVAWLEANGPSDSQIMLRRFDTNLAPVGAPITVGSSGAVGLGDLDIAAAGPNAYGIAAAGSNSTQQLFTITCN